MQILAPLTKKMEPNTNLNEHSWLIEFRNGNESGLNFFFNQHYKSLYFFSIRIVQDEQEAQDIVSESLVKLWERHSDFNSAQSIKAFLYLSCRNSCLDYLKHLKVRSAVQETYLRHIEQGEEIILNQIIKTEVFDILNREIELLPEKCREIFKLIYLDNKKTDEIATELGLSVQTVRNQKTKAIELLRTSMIKKGLVGPLALLLFMTGY